MKNSIKKVVLISAVMIGVFAVLLLLLLFIPIPIYPSPEHDVASYEELIKETDGLCIAPEKNVFNSDESHYTVYLESRFSNKVTGYLISFPAIGEAGSSVSVESKAATMLPDESKEITPTAFYEGVGLEVGENHICFILNGFLYNINGSVEEEALSIAQNIIDRK